MRLWSHWGFFTHPAPGMPSIYWYRIDTNMSTVKNSLCIKRVGQQCVERSIALVIFAQWEPNDNSRCTPPRSPLYSESARCVLLLLLRSTLGQLTKVLADNSNKESISSHSLDSRKRSTGTRIWIGLISNVKSPDFSNNREEGAGVIRHRCSGEQTLKLYECFAISVSSSSSSFCSRGHTYWQSSS